MRRSLSFALTAAASLGGALVLATPAKAAADGCYWVAIKSQKNNRYVSAEVNYPGQLKGMLRARATGIGPWETFLICEFGDSVIRSQATDSYTSAEVSFPGTDSGMLRARAPQVGPWERFRIISCGTTCRIIRSEKNGRWVSAELNYPGSDPRYGMLRARATDIGPWEKFTFERL